MAGLRAWAHVAKRVLVPFALGDLVADLRSPSALGRPAPFALGCIVAAWADLRRRGRSGRFGAAFRPCPPRPYVADSTRLVDCSTGWACTGAKTVA